MSEQGRQPSLQEILAMRYNLSHELNRGAMGVVYAAHDKLDNSPVAIKVALGFHDETDKKRFIQEAETGRRLDHPNIIKVRDLGGVGNQVYLAMDYVQGKNMQQVMQDLRPGAHLPLETVVNWVTQQASALDYAHSQGVIHRDYAAKQIMIDQEGNSLLTDFGLARRSDNRMTLSGEIMGTPTTMAPEMAGSDAKKTDHRIDFYGLGCVAFELLENDTLIDQAKLMGGPTAMLLNIATAPRNKLSRNDIEVKKVQPVINRMTAFNPEDRYDTATEFAHDLSLALGILPEHLRRENREQDSIRRSNSSRIQQTLDRGSTPWYQKFGPIIIGGAIALGGISAALLGSSTNNQTPRETPVEVPQPVETPEPVVEPLPTPDVPAIPKSKVSFSVPNAEDVTQTQVTQVSYHPFDQQTQQYARRGIDLTNGEATIDQGQGQVRIFYTLNGLNKQAFMPATLDDSVESIQWLEPEFDPNDFSQGQRKFFEAPAIYVSAVEGNKEVSEWIIPWTIQDQARFAGQNYLRGLSGDVVANIETNLERFMRDLSQGMLGERDAANLSMYLQRRHELLTRLPSDPRDTETYRTQRGNFTHNIPYFRVNPQGGSTHTVIPITRTLGNITPDNMGQFPLVYVMRGHANDPLAPQGFQFTVPQRVTQALRQANVQGSYQVGLISQESGERAFDMGPLIIPEAFRSYGRQLQREGITALRPISHDGNPVSAWGVPIVAPHAYTISRGTDDNGEYFERMNFTGEQPTHERARNPDGRAPNATYFRIRRVPKVH